MKGGGGCALELRENESCTQELGVICGGEPPPLPPSWLLTKFKFENTVILIIYLLDILII